MKIQFIAQATILVSTEDCNILCDPWLFGTAFNDSWRLFPNPQFDDHLYDKINYLWISHEHPDHFHIPTLRAMPKKFKERVVVLFQKNNSDKMPNAFRKLGFNNIKLMPHRKIIELTNKTKVYNHQVGQMDSALAVITKDHTVLNLNDCEANSSDCKRFLADLGRVDTVLNQFSMAGYSGNIDYKKHLPILADNIIKGMLDNHRDLKAKTTIPFASYVFFCCEDNRYMNEFANTPNKVYTAFLKENLHMDVLFNNDVFDSDRDSDAITKNALERYKLLYDGRSELQFDKGEIIHIGEIEAAIKKRYEQIASKFPKILCNKLKPIVVKIPDLNTNLRLCLADGSSEQLPANSDFDLIIFSQPLFFAFNFEWGVQTLGVSARWLCKSNDKIWRWYRIITSLNNAEIYLKPKYIFSKKNMKFLQERLGGGLNQLVYQLQRMG
jgi:UDP-MurNAc hydroxylase